MQPKKIFGDLEKINNYTVLNNENEASFFTEISEFIREKTEKNKQNNNRSELIEENKKKNINIENNETKMIGKKTKKNVNIINDNFIDVNNKKHDVNKKRNYICNTCVYYKNLNKEIIKEYQKEINHYKKLSNDYEKELLFYKRIFKPKKAYNLEIQNVISNEICKHNNKNKLEIQNICSFTLNEEEEYNDDDSLVTVSTMVGKKKYKKHITRKEYFKILDDEGFDIH